MSFGDWEMVPWKNIDRELFEKWAGDFVNITCPGGESYRGMYQRVSEFWDDLLKREHESAAVVTHAGVIHAILARVTGMELAKTLLFFFDYGSVSRVSIKGPRTVVKYLNR
jgi:alpha-ribazole phosphatase